LILFKQLFALQNGISTQLLNFEDKTPITKHGHDNKENIYPAKISLIS